MELIYVRDGKLRDALPDFFLERINKSSEIFPLLELGTIVHPQILARTICKFLIRKLYEDF